MAENRAYHVPGGKQTGPVSPKIGLIGWLSTHAVVGPINRSTTDVGFAADAGRGGPGISRRRGCFPSLACRRLRLSAERESRFSASFLSRDYLRAAYTEFGATLSVSLDSSRSGPQRHVCLLESMRSLGGA